MLAEDGAGEEALHSLIYASMKGEALGDGEKGLWRLYQYYQIHNLDRIGLRLT